MFYFHSVHRRATSSDYGGGVRDVKYISFPWLRRGFYYQPVPVHRRKIIHFARVNPFLRHLVLGFRDKTSQKEGNTDPKWFNGYDCENHLYVTKCGSFQLRIRETYTTDYINFYLT